MRFDGFTTSAGETGRSGGKTLGVFMVLIACVSLLEASKVSHSGVRAGVEEGRWEGRQGRNAFGSRIDALAQPMHGLATQEGGREKEGREAGGRLRLGNQEYETMCGNGLRLRGGSEELVNGADEEEDGEPLSPLKEKV